MQHLLMKDYPQPMMFSDFKDLIISDFHKLLEQHPFFLNFCGHPHAISLIAPMTREYTLVQLYELVNSKVFFQSSESEAHQLNALTLSMQASVNFIINKQPKAIDLFSLIGLLPGGVSKDSLTKIWGPDWYNYMAHLMEA